MKLYTVLFHAKNHPEDISNETVEAVAVNYAQTDRVVSTVYPVWNNIEQAEDHARFQNQKYEGTTHYVVEATLIWGPRTGKIIR